MSISKVQILNITLNILGISTPLENPNISDNRAILLNNYYELAKNYVLRDFDWNFASTFRKLSLYENQDIKSKYQYVYDYPNDCIHARDIFQEGSWTLQKFSVCSADDGNKIILCDLSDAILRYTRNVDKEIYFTSEFAMAFAYYLSSLTSNVLTGSLQKGEIAYEKYKNIIKHAKMLNAQEGADEIYSDTTYLDSRG